MPCSSSEAKQFQYGLNRFLKETRTLAQFDHANIVGVQDFFEDNGTAYLVMDYHEGKPLDVYLDERAMEEQTWPSSFRAPARDQQGWPAKRIVVDVEE